MDRREAGLCKLQPRQTLNPKQYPVERFDGRVERIECQDHNPPKMNQIISFVERLRAPQTLKLQSRMMNQIISFVERLRGPQNLETLNSAK